MFHQAIFFVPPKNSDNSVWPMPVVNVTSVAALTGASNIFRHYFYCIHLLFN